MASGSINFDDIARDCTPPLYPVERAALWSRCQRRRYVDPAAVRATVARLHEHADREHSASTGCIGGKRENHRPRADDSGK